MSVTVVAAPATATEWVSDRTTIAWPWRIRYSLWVVNVVVWPTRSPASMTPSRSASFQTVVMVVPVDVPVAPIKTPSALYRYWVIFRVSVRTFPLAERELVRASDTIAWPAMMRYALVVLKVVVWGTRSPGSITPSWSASFQTTVVVDPVAVPPAPINWPRALY